jgi:hypothetical protein
VGAYDRSLPLVVDPGLVFSTFIGGGEPDVGIGIAVDADGYAYVGGENTDPDFPTTAGSYDPTYNGRDEAWVAKLDPAGTTLVYSTYVGGTDSDAAFALAIDADGAVYLTGETQSADFPTTTGAYDETYNGGLDVFVSKLDPTGSILEFSTVLGGTVTGSPPGLAGDHGSDIAVDQRGDVYVTGFTESPDFPTTPGALDETFNGDFDAFVAKFDPTGSNLLYSTVLGGPGHERGEDLAVNSKGKVYVAGHTTSSDFPTTPGAYDTTLNGQSDAFVVKLNPSGSALVYGTFVGGADLERGLGMDVDASGRVFVTGLTSSTDYPTTPGAYDQSSNGGGDAYVFELDTTGSSLVASTYLGGDVIDQGWELVLDPSGQPCIVGTASSNHPAGRSDV